MLRWSSIGSLVPAVNCRLLKGKLLDIVSRREGNGANCGGLLRTTRVLRSGVRETAIGWTFEDLRLFCSAVNRVASAEMVKGGGDCAEPQQGLLQCCDPRTEAMKRFRAFLHTADMCDAYDSSRIRLKGEGGGDAFMFPVALVTGAEGSGKTSLLELSCAEFERKHPDGKCLTVEFHDFDKDRDVPTRIAHGLLHAASMSAQPAEQFWRALSDVVGFPFLSTNGLNGDDVEERPLTVQRPAQPTNEDIAQWSWFTCPCTLIAVCRMICKMEPSAPLLIVVDELSCLCTTVGPPVGHECGEAVEALTFLGSLSDESLVAWGDADHPTAPVYIVAAVCALSEVTRAMSLRPVYLLPLTPLSLCLSWNCHVRQLAGASVEAAEAGRRLLWQHQHNARDATNAYHWLRTTDPCRWGDGELSDFRSSVQAYISACTAERLDPAELLRNLFWAVPNASQGRPQIPRHVLLAEATGLCTILTSGGTAETVFMSPTAALQLCSAVVHSRRGANHEPFALPSSVVELVLGLCTELVSQATQPSPDCGWYQRTVVRCLACRVATAPHETFPLSDLFPRNSDAHMVLSSRLEQHPNHLVRKFFDTLVSRCAFPIVDFDSKPNAFETQKCFTCSLVVGRNALIALSRPFGERRLLIGLCMSNDEDGAATRFRELHGNNMLMASVQGSDFVHVLVAPHTPPGFTLLRWGEGEDVYHEALLTHNDLRRSCPMVAFSGCDRNSATGTGASLP